MIRARLSFRHQKHVQYELVQEALETQRDKLEILENAEREAKRLEEALERGGNVLTGPQVEPVPARDEQERAQRRARATQGFGLLSAVKHSLSGMIDMDPEATRRANIAKTRDNISQVILFFLSSLIFVHTLMVTVTPSWKTLIKQQRKTSNTRP